jgi:hypothetical protein
MVTTGVVLQTFGDSKQPASKPLGKKYPVVQQPVAKHPAISLVVAM